MLQITLTRFIDENVSAMKATLCGMRFGLNMRHQGSADATRRPSTRKAPEEVGRPALAPLVFRSRLNRTRIVTQPKSAQSFNPFPCKLIIAD
jgi:hypothetical protein